MLSVEQSNWLDTQGPSRAASIGLQERAWRLSEQSVLLPSGPRLTRGGFREVQAWLVVRCFADKEPQYHLVVTPEQVLTALES